MNPSMVDGNDADPRLARSRARLLDAATRLLHTGGVEAVTVDAVTRNSKVAKTTLYRHFGSTRELLAAAFEHLLPHITPPSPTGSLREQLIEILSRQAALLESTPLHLTLLAWLATGPLSPSGEASETGHPTNPSRSSLHSRVMDHYSEPFNEVMRSPQARAQLGDIDVTLALAQLLGPLVFGRLTGIRTIDRNDCVRLVDAFLAINTIPAQSEH